MIYEFTDDDFSYFKEQCYHWEREFGLQSWDISYEFSDEYPEYFGWNCVNYDGRSAVVYLSKTVENDGDRTKNEILKSTAFHEICEVFLTDMKQLSEREDLHESTITVETHRVINTLEKLLI